MATLYHYQDTNIAKTWMLFFFFFVLVIGFGFVFSQIYQDPGILYFAVVFSLVANFVSYFASDKIALSLAGARPIEKKDNPQLYSIIENLCITAGLPIPRIYITPERQINAFATGRNAKHAAVAVTAGALERLTKNELEGVLAHELSHIGNRDILVSTVAVVLVGMISMAADFFLRSSLWGVGRRRDREGDSGQVLFFVGIILAILAPIGATLMQLAISRRREALADASGVLLTRYPDGLADALQKIAADSAPMTHASTSTAHLWIDSPFKKQDIAWYQKLFMTHPPIAERIAALRAMGK